MTFEERKKKLSTLPWQALFEVAIEKEIDEAEVNGKDKDAIIDRLLSTAAVSDEEIDALVENYIYGSRITFTLWSFNNPLSQGDYDTLLQLGDRRTTEFGSRYFRNLHFLSVERNEDRFEILYTYSKEYSYVDEEGRNSSVWEQHRGCLWIGTDISYLACISKHDKMTACMVKYISGELNNTLSQIHPPKAAIEKCIHYKALSRIVLQGIDGEKTIISRSGGITSDQEDEIARIRHERLDTSGSYIADITDEISASVKYNTKKGSIGIQKHIPTSVLFDWSKNAINIIFEEISKLKGKPATEIFAELGLEIKWPGFEDKRDSLNWFLTNTISALGEQDELEIAVPAEMQHILQNNDLFYKIPMVYCSVCNSYEQPHCAECGAKLERDESGNIKRCSCGAPIKIACPEGHYCSIEYWYIPKSKLSSLINKNINRAFKEASTEYFMCITGTQLRIVCYSENGDDSVEVRFEDVDCFSRCAAETSDRTRSFAVRLNEKCNGTCSIAKIEQCLRDNSMICLPKVFYPVLPGFRPQPHKGGEYGDVSAEVKVKQHSYEMKGIIKKNSQNGRTNKPDSELIQSNLLSTSKPGEEMIRQFVEQGMADSRCKLVAVIAPQYFDHSFKGTLRYLAKLANKKILFIELNEICRIIDLNDGIIVP